MTTAAEFLTERRDFLYVYTTPSPGGEGWDVVLRVDGTYSDKELAEACAEGVKQMINAIEDVPKTGRDWWRGAPWKARR